MNSYKRAVRILEAEHKIVDVVYTYIDRMNDVTEEDTLEKIAGEFLIEANRAIKAHLECRWR